jgi:large subunit ribosomal protein L25
MSKIVQLKATARGRAGKGASRAVRREGLVPAVVYGDKKDAQLVSLKYGEVQPHVHTGRFLSTLVDLEVDGQTVRAIPRDVQFEPVKDRIVHVDFLRLGKGTRINVEVAVTFKNQDICPGLKKGGVLNVISHELALYCSADFIPDEVQVDLGSLDIGRSIHLSDIKLPEGVSPVGKAEDVTIVTVTSPKVEKEEEVAAAEAAPTEVPATAQKALATAPGAAPAASGKAAPAAAAAPAAGGKAAPAAAAAPAKGGEKKK